MTLLRIVKHQVINTVEIDEHGVNGPDRLSYLASVAMDDAREGMTPDGPSTATYQMDDGIALISITVDHNPHGQSPALTVDQAKRALREATRREREQRGSDGAVPA